MKKQGLAGSILSYSDTSGAHRQRQLVCLPKTQRVLHRSLPKKRLFYIDRDTDPED